MKNKKPAKVKRLLVRIFPLTFFFTGALFLTSCDDKGAAEEAGEKIDDKVEDVKDNAEDVAEETEEGIEEATE